MQGMTFDVPPILIPVPFFMLGIIYGMAVDSVLLSVALYCLLLSNVIIAFAYERSTEKEINT